MPPQAGKLEKAYLALVKPPTPANKPPSLSAVVGKAKAGGEGRITFGFNPKELSISKSASWTRQSQPGAAQVAMPEFTGAEPATLTVEIFLDASESSSPHVAADVQTLLDCVTPMDATISANSPSPPWVVFGWGTYTSFVAVVKQVQARYTMFRPDGTPVRAVCSVTLEEVPTTPPPRQNPTSGALATYRTHVVVAGDTLPSVAQREYGDPTRWRTLAEANGIDDPMRLVPGTQLTVPTAVDEPVGV